MSTPTEISRVVRSRVADALERAGSTGAALSELRVLMPDIKRSTIYSAMVALREASRAFAISRKPVAIYFAASVDQDAARASFRDRYPTLKAEIAQAISLGFQVSDKAAARRNPGRPPGAKDIKPRRRATPRQRLDQLQSNRVARSVQGDGTHGAAPSTQPVTITWPEGLKPTICPPVRGRFDRLVSTGDSGVAPQVGRYSVPASNWASAAISTSPERSPA